MPGNHAVFISDLREARLFLSQIGIDQAAYDFMAPKAVFRCIKLKNIPCRWANVIKQEMLSKGGEAAVSRESLYAEGNTDILLMGTIKQYQRLIKKLQMQPPILKKLGAEIKTIIDSLEPKRFIMQLAGNKILEFGQRTHIMGILNVTPDSFSDSGRYYKEQEAIARGMEMIAQGADIIDIGGASSRPGAEITETEEEIRRVIPLVKRLAKENVVLSVDTFRARVARESLAAGAHIINDIGRLQLDKQLLPVLIRYQAPVVLMHNRLQFNQGIPYDDLVADIISELEESIQEGVNRGLNPEQIIIDPGLGFGKDTEQNIALLKNLQDFKSLGKPILIGASRKRFIGKILDSDVGERLEGTLAVTAISIMNGANIIRVHDVGENVKVARLTDAVVYNNG